MLTHTKAYLRLRKQAKEMWDFTVTMCYAVPSLKEQIKLLQIGTRVQSLASPDYFKGSMNLDELRGRSADYKSKLSRYIVLSSFSFFEAYIVEAITEMIEFHGGTEAFLSRTQQKAHSSIVSVNSSIIDSKRKLQEPEKPGKYLKYIKYSKKLTEAGYKFPSELLSSYGVLLLTEKISNLRSADIPNLLTQAFHYNIDSERFHQIRDMRNKIAHGKGSVIRLTLSKSIRANEDLRDFATNIDKHLVEHYFVLEKYV